MRPNPCLPCGACCAYYCAAFYWRETDDETPGGVPLAMTVEVDEFRRAMKGTKQPIPRCVALQGTVGESVSCSIYERRANVCRDFPPSYEGGERNERCDKARAAHGLPALTPEDWLEPGTAGHKTA